VKESVSSGREGGGRPCSRNPRSMFLPALAASGHPSASGIICFGAGNVACQATSAETSAEEISAALPSPSKSSDPVQRGPKRSSACMPWCWFSALMVNCLSDVITPFCVNGRITRSVSTPSSSSRLTEPSGSAETCPNSTPLALQRVPDRLTACACLRASCHGLTADHRSSLWPAVPQGPRRRDGWCPAHWKTADRANRNQRFRILPRQTRWRQSRLRRRWQAGCGRRHRILRRGLRFCRTSARADVCVVSDRSPASPPAGRRRRAW
jgi:hypothetical protein